MARHINIEPYKITKAHKQALSDFLLGKIGVIRTAQIMGITQQRLYTIVTVLMRHSCVTGQVDIEEILKTH